MSLQNLIIPRQNLKKKGFCFWSLWFVPSVNMIMDGRWELIGYPCHCDMTVLKKHKHHYLYWFDFTSLCVNILSWKPSQIGPPCCKWMFSNNRVQFRGALCDNKSLIYLQRTKFANLRLPCMSITVQYLDFWLKARTLCMNYINRLKTLMYITKVLQLKFAFLTINGPFYDSDTNTCYSISRIY